MKRHKIRGEYDEGERSREILTYYCLMEFEKLHAEATQVSLLHLECSHILDDEAFSKAHPVNFHTDNIKTIPRKR